jgi:hypothetical protein
MRNRASTPWVRPTKLLWLPAVGALFTAVALFGTPHVLWTYRYSGSPEAKHYLSCDYVGRDSQTVVPSHGTCPLIALLKPVKEGRGG